VKPERLKGVSWANRADKSAKMKFWGRQKPKVFERFESWIDIWVKILVFTRKIARKSKRILPVNACSQTETHQS
jgi:hypothetical protein